MGGRQESTGGTDKCFVPTPATAATPPTSASTSRLGAQHTRLAPSIHEQCHVAAKVAFCWAALRVAQRQRHLVVGLYAGIGCLYVPHRSIVVPRHIKQVSALEACTETQSRHKQRGGRGAARRWARQIEAAAATCDTALMTAITSIARSFRGCRARRISGSAVWQGT